MFFSRSHKLPSGRVIHFAIEDDSAPVSYADAIRLWQSDSDFRAFFIDLLSDSPFPAFRWETPPVTMATADKPFEFVLLDAPEIALASDPGPFATYFDSAAPGGVVEFPNLGGDAILIVPCPGDPLADFGHLGAYLRNARELQQDQLWKAVGSAMQRRISSQPVWLNTAGGGVAWLHIRLDDRPKYYGYAPYRYRPT
ncbi:MAG: hypothetical protein QNI89_12460 [Desulfobacterales bacterium]|nr:hypothetical protein [Desulfobacterales bacterium]